jgi:hypothetical protein
MDLKDLKNINIIVPTKLNEIKPELEIIINTTSSIITKFLETQVYTSVVSESDKIKLDAIFIKNKTIILGTL